jgi:DNA-binding Lrp family transcriptional regulator
MAGLLDGSRMAKDRGIGVDKVPSSTSKGVKMEKEAYGEVFAKVRALCARPVGVSLAEASDEIGRSQNAVSVYIAKLVGSGDVVRAGVYGEYRYFKNRKKAAEHDVVAKAARDVRMAEAKKRKNERRAQKERENRAIARAQKVVQAVKKAKPKKVHHIVIQSVRQSKDQLRQHKEATIVWPEHVKVQRIPTPADMRFAPEPGYKGSFLQEWHERRAA